jgi:S1-C subfamily serine protease
MRVLFVGAAWVVAVILAPVTCAAQQINQNSTPADVTKLLGVPIQVAIDANTTTWRYGARRDVVFANGRVGARRTESVVCIRTNDAFYHTPDCPSLKGQLYVSKELGDVDALKYRPDPLCHPPYVATQAAADSYPQTSDGLRGLALYYSRSTQYAMAIQMANRCLSLKPKDKHCAEIQRIVRPKYIEETQRQLRAIPANDLHAKRTVLRGAAAINGATNAFATELAAIDAALQGVVDEVHRYVHDLHSTQSVPQVPSTLLIYVDTVPEAMLAVAESQFHIRIGKTEHALAQQNFAQAYDIITPVVDHVEAAPTLRRVHDAARSYLDEQWAKTKAANSIKGLDQFVAALEAFKGPLDNAELLLARTDATTFAADLLQRRFTQAQTLDPASARVVSLALQRSAPTLAKLLEERRTGPSGSAPLVAAAYDAGQAVTACPDLQPAVATTATANQQLPYPFAISKSADVEFVQRIHCVVETTDEPPEPFSSRYVATYQQDTNPRYVQLQTALQAAQTNLAQLKIQNALNPPANVWVGLANGVAEVAAQANVTSIQRQLSDTAPFVSRPVELAYTAYKTKARRTATISVSLALNDRVSAFGDSVQLLVSSESVDDGLQGINERDSDHLQNRKPSPSSPGELLTKTMEQVAAQVIVGSRQLGERMFVARAAASVAAHRPVGETLGNLLFARDLMNNALDLQLYASTFQALDSATLETLDSIKLDPGIFLKPKRATPSPSTAPRLAAPSSRAQMLQHTMGAVVAVKTSEGSGSGFFVGSEGLLLTNAHVVEGAAIVAVHTSDGESFLASTVSISSDYDLALLKTNARPKLSLRLGDSAGTSVGTDIWAIGNPLGLEGTVTKGIVSGIRKMDGVTYLQIDAAINPGNSGGPLMTDSGEVVGINTWKIRRNGTEALGFAIAVDDAKKIFSNYLGDGIESTDSVPPVATAPVSQRPVTIPNQTATTATPRPRDESKVGRTVPPATPPITPTPVQAAIPKILGACAADGAATAASTVAVAVANAPVFVQPRVLQVPLTTLAVGTPLPVVETSGAWYLIAFNDRQWGDREGYVHCGNVTAAAPR